MCSLEASSGFLTLGQIPDEPGEMDLSSRSGFADRQAHGKGRAILPPADDDAVETDDAPLASVQVALQIAVVLFPIG